MKLVFTESDINRVINALDLYSRVWIGQYDHIMFEMRWKKDYRKLDDIDSKLTQLFKSIRAITLPELTRYGFNGSHGIFSLDRDVRAGIAYDLQQEIRYKAAWFENPEGGYTVNYRTPLPCEDDPYPFPHAICRRENERTIMEVEIVAGQAEVIINALITALCLEKGNFIDLFSHYTNDKTALNFAREITDLYAGVAHDKHYSSQIEALVDLIERIYDQILVNRAVFRCPFADVDIMIPRMIEGAKTAVCPVCGVPHEVPHDDAGRKRIWHRNRNMFMPVN